MSPSGRKPLVIGDRFSVTIEKVAHGGHFIARHEGAVIFVRHAIPGEVCTIEITSVGASFNRADVIEVEEKSPDRVSAPCRYAHRQGCGGCDFQHISPLRQRELKADVIREQFARIAKMEITVQVEEVSTPLGWRTRCTAVTTKAGALGFYQARSHSIVPVDDCRILVPEIKFAELSAHGAQGDQRIEISLSNTGERTIATANTRGETQVKIYDGADIAHYAIAGRVLEVSQKSFWQSHKDAPRVLTEVVKEFAGVVPGDQILDLYGGVGLFTAALLPELGSDGAIHLVEGSKSATADARRNFADDGIVSIHTGDVAKILPRFTQANVVILDPPREGAGREVAAECARLRPRSIVYVACDPAALARDVSYLRENGYSLAQLRAFDLFPMTHHMECVALLTLDKVS